VTTRLWRGGRVAWASGADTFVPSAHNSEPCLPVVGPGGGLPEGPSIDDPEDGLSYRLVAPVRLAPDQGWKRTAAWCEELGCTMARLRELVQAGLFDAATERGSPHRMLRALDLPRAKAALLTVPEAECKQLAGRRRRF